MITKQTKLLIFDMDGLLVDTERVYKEGWEYGLRKMNFIVPTEILNSWTGKSVHDTQAYLLRVCHTQEVCDRVRMYREEYIYTCLNNGNLKAKPYAKEALKKAYESGYTIALATSTCKKRAVTILSELSLLPYIQYPVFSDDVILLKPHPDLYLEVLHRSKIKAENALVFEDSLTGYQAAKAANIKTILIPDQSFKIDEEAIRMIEHKEHDLSVIINWIEQLNGMR